MKKHFKYSLFALGFLAITAQFTLCAASEDSGLEKETRRPSMSEQASLPVDQSMPEPKRVKIGVRFPNQYYKNGTPRCGAHGRWCVGQCVILPVYQLIEQSPKELTNSSK